MLIYVHAYTYIYVYMHTYMRIYIYIYIYYKRTCVCTHVYVYMYICRRVWLSQWPIHMFKESSGLGCRLEVATNSEATFCFHVERPQRNANLLSKGTLENAISWVQLTGSPCCVGGCNRCPPWHPYICSELCAPGGPLLVSNAAPSSAHHNWRKHA